MQLVNDEARRLLELPDDVVGRSHRRARAAARAGAGGARRHRRGRRRSTSPGDQVLVVSSAPATWAASEVGAVVTLRDHTELQAVTGELDVVRGLTESLRSQNHEAANRLHTVVSLIEMGRAEEAVDFATEELQVAQALTDQRRRRGRRPGAGRAAARQDRQAAERGIELVVDGDVSTESAAASRRATWSRWSATSSTTRWTPWPAAPSAGCACASSETRRPAAVVVGDSGPALPAEDAARVLERGWSTKAGAAAAGSGWPSSPRSRVATVARSTSAARPSAARSSRRRPRRRGAS